MKKLFLVLLIAVPLMAQNGRVYLNTNSAIPFSEKSTTYANYQRDTVIWTREMGVAGISFVIHAKDSVRFSNDSGCVMFRIVDGAMTKVAGDTLNLSLKLGTVDGNASTLSFTNGSVFYFTPTYTPYFDQIAFIVKYHVTGNGVTTPNVNYRVEKLYNTTK